jgi:uncharacterized protein (TIGR02646 family)
MIRIEKPAAPAVLLTRGADAARALCDAFDTGTREFDFDPGIYNHATVRAELVKAQYGKCAFCESKVTHVSSGDIEHYRPKGASQQKKGGALRTPGYYWLAYRWENLFFACGRCNQTHKKNLFPLRDWRTRAASHSADLTNEEPLLLDPGASAPDAHIGFRAERAFARPGSREGKATIAVLGLERPDLVEERGARLREVRRLVELCVVLRAEVSDGASAAVAARLAVHEADLQARDEPHRPYSAMVRAYLQSVGER